MGFNSGFKGLTRSGVGEDFILSSIKERIPIFFDTMLVRQKVMKLGSLKLGTGSRLIRTLFD